VMQSPEVCAAQMMFSRESFDKVTADSFPIEVQKLFVEQFLKDNDILDFYEDQLKDWKGLA